MKDTSYYFSHDFNARQDAKIKRLIMKHGMAGYGMFWAIVEDLYNNANALPTDYESIAFDLRTDSETIESIITGFDLFVINQNTFGSMSIQKRLDEREEKSKKAKKAARIRWENNDSNAGAMQTHTDSNAIKEKKEEESKEDKRIEIERKKKRNEQFEKFWNLYDHKKGKKASLDAWMKLTDEEIDMIRKTVRTYLSETKDKNFRKHPSTYLNQKVWLDYTDQDGKLNEEMFDDTAGDIDNGWRVVPMSEAYEIVRDLSPTSMHEAELRGEADEYVRKVMNARVQYEVHGNAWKTRK